MARVRSIEMWMVILIATLTAAGGAQASWGEDGIPVYTGDGEQCTPIIVNDGSGGTIVIWTDRDVPHPRITDLYAQRLDEHGTRLWPESGVPVCEGTGSENYYQAVPDGSGGAIVVWANTGLSPMDLFAQRIDSNGQQLWAVYGIRICETPERRDCHQIISDGEGGVIIAWQVDLVSGDIFAQRLDGGGNRLWGPNGIMVSGSYDAEGEPQIASDGAGGAIIAWSNYYNDTVRAQRVSADGTRLWGGTQILSDMRVWDAASDGFGGAVFACRGVSSLEDRVYAQRVDSEGYILWDDGALVSFGTGLGVRVEPRIIADGSGGFIVGWLQYIDWPEYSVYAQRIDTEGRALWTPFDEPIGRTGGLSTFPTLAPDGSGGAVVTWHCNSYYGCGPDGIYAQHISASGEIQWPAGGAEVCVVESACYHLYPAIVNDGAGGVVIAWKDARAPCDADIYADRLLLGGAPPEEGACCLGDGVCEVLTENACLLAGGEYQGTSTSCDPNPCEEPGEVWLDSFDDGDISDWTLENPYQAGDTSIIVEASTEESLSPSYSLKIDGPDEWYYGAKGTGPTVPIDLEEPYTIVFSFRYHDAHFFEFATFGPVRLLIDNTQGRLKCGTTSGWGWFGTDDFDDFCPADTWTRFRVEVNPDSTIYHLYVDDIHRGSCAYGSYDSGKRGFHFREKGGAYWDFLDHGYYDDMCISETPISDVPVTPLTRPPSLSDNTPNPFGQETEIRFTLDRRCEVGLTVFDIQGRRVATLLDGSQSAGSKAVRWAAQDAQGLPLPSGVYFYRLVTGHTAETKKMIFKR